MSVFNWSRGEELNLNRLYKARKLLELAGKSGWLVDRSPEGEIDTLTCTKGAIALINLAIGVEERSKGNSN